MLSTHGWVAYKSVGETAPGQLGDRPVSAEIHHRVTVNQDNILVVQTPREVRRFIDEFSNENRRVSWRNLKANYDGVRWVHDDENTADAMERLRQILPGQVPESNTDVI